MTGAWRSGARLVGEVADRALEVRGHARLGGGDVAGLEHREHLVVLDADLRR